MSAPINHASCVKDILDYASGELISTLQYDEPRLMTTYSPEDVRAAEQIIQNAGHYHRFIQMIAHLTQDGEERDDGTFFDMPCDDAVTTLNRLIAESRDLISPTQE